MHRLVASRFARLVPSWRRIALLITTLSTSLLLSCGGCDCEPQGATPYEPSQGTRVLTINPVAQQTEVWCWAASAEMVFRHYGLPNINPAGNYQCGIVAAYFGPSSPCWFDCFACISSIASMSQMQLLINGYGSVARQFTPSRVLGSRLLFSALSFSDTAREIDDGRPIVAGISPNGFVYPNISQHAVVIVGYQNNASGQWVIVNDPFPYDTVPSSPNPYMAFGATRLRPGQYLVAYAALLSGLRWGNTLYQIQ